MSSVTFAPPNVPPWTSGDRSSRANNFDFLRMVLALGVIVAHAWPLMRTGIDPRVEAGEWVTQWTRTQVSLGGFCVHGFFIISGYLIAASWVHSRTGRSYFAKRIRRIYPGFIVATALSYGAAWLGGAPVVIGLRNIAERCLAVVLLGYVVVPSAFLTNPLPASVNGSMWTIQYEFYCYVFVALVGGLIVNRRVVLVFGLIIVLAILAAIIHQTHWQHGLGRLSEFVGLPAAWPRLASHFFAGTAFYIVRDRVPYSGKLVVVAAGILLLGSLLPPVLIAVSPFALTYMIMWIAFHRGIRLHHFGKYGDFSYGVYLYAFPIQQLLIHYQLTLTVWQNILTAIPLAILAGVLSWHLIERPFLHFRVSGRRPDVVENHVVATTNGPRP